MTHLFIHFIKKIIWTLRPNKSFDKWKKRLKQPHELTPEERKEWLDEQDQMWQEYYDNLL
jgi:hypothetical protein